MKKIVEKREGPGRPEMDVKPTLIRLGARQAERIDAVAGAGKRAEFIREAVERELRRRERRG